MRNEIRDSVVIETKSRLVAAYVRQAELPGGVPLDVLINDTLYHEKKRLEIHKHAPNREADLEFWSDIKRRLPKAGDSELRVLLERIVHYFIVEIEGNFNPLVYDLSTSILPKALPLLLNAMSPRRVMQRGVPELAETVRLMGEIEALRRCQRLGTVILVPTHVSNLDSVVVGWALYALKLPPFTYGAGLNLFSNPALSYFMRNLGAYRVDRTKKAPIYKEILKEYSTVSLEVGQPQLFFPGGTRARSGQVEEKLKLGLLSCGLRAYIHNLIRQRPNPKIFVVPCTLTFQLVLEASTLIEDHLRQTGKSRYIITDDESFRPPEILRFLMKLASLDSPIFVNFGPPLDPFGNRVDEDGESLDQRGRRVDISRYVNDADGKPIHMPQRDRVYTLEVGKAILKTFREYNVVLATHMVAFSLFEHLRTNHPGMDLYRLLRTAGDGSGVDMSLIAQQVKTIQKRARKLAADKLVHIAPDIANAQPSRIIAIALQHFDTYHRGGVISRHGDRLFADDMNLVYYYRNRLVGYGFLASLEQ